MGMTKAIIVLVVAERSLLVIEGTIATVVGVGLPKVEWQVIQFIAAPANNRLDFDARKTRAVHPERQAGL